MSLYCIVLFLYSVRILFSHQLQSPPKEQPELIVVKEEPPEFYNGDTEQDRTCEDSEYLQILTQANTFLYHEIDLESESSRSKMLQCLTCSSAVNRDGSSQRHPEESRSDAASPTRGRTSAASVY